jgi:hypothetical protein
MSLDNFRFLFQRFKNNMQTLSTIHHQNVGPAMASRARYRT